MDASIVTSNSTTLQNLIRSVEGATRILKGVVIEPLALGGCCLQGMKELGVVVIDVGTR